MARQITHECGYVVRAETEEEVVDLTLDHLRRDHPPVAGQMTREDVVALIEVLD